ncbi:hypothetical protein [Variovorax boronicumulans]|uniref:hypothetical protein n=1 Tax=Variovorax boronicumulans TaxID=436515 RepID=UPI0027896E94|nr:hypothetical protein [Variovorax boronicumulans]MDQ0045401.1 hypothetical protein [Variovorax boronicumulans]
MPPNELIGRGGAGRGQGRKPISGDARPYKLLLPAELRAKLDELGGAEWLRTQLSLATYLDEINLEKAMNLAARYIDAMRQLPQYFSNLDCRGPLTHVMTGVRVLPLGDLSDPEDDGGILEVIYPGGHRVEVNGYALYQMALAEGVRWEIDSNVDDIPRRKRDVYQARIADLDEHLRRKHSLI